MAATAANARRQLRVTYVGGPTAILEFGGQRFVTDPTFDPAGSEFRSGAYLLRKEQGPALIPDGLGGVHAVLLSHDHHFDNLDASGRAFLDRVPAIVTTEVGAGRLGDRALGLAPWQSTQLGDVTITATPARHGPAHADRGPVIGFALSTTDTPKEVVYVSGDTVWYDGVAEVARWFDVKVAILFMGAARVDAVGPWPLTFTAADGVEAARVFPAATIVPLHFEGWKHFREHRQEIDQVFGAAGLADRLDWLSPAVPRVLTWW